MLALQLTPLDHTNSLHVKCPAGRATAGSKPVNDRVFEVVGVYHKNHGAVLMLEAIRAQLRERYGSAHIALPLRGSFDFRRRYADKIACPFLAHSRLEVLAARLAPVARFADKFDVVMPGGVDARIDASGFAYGDFWGHKKLKMRLLRPLQAFPERKVILMPQAFGPFRRPGMAHAICEAMERVDLAFVRDAQSMEYLKEAGVEQSDRVRLAPDFTNLLSVPPADGTGGSRLLIIPNQKVLDTAVEFDRARYIAFLETAAIMSREAGLTPVFLIHEGQKDLSIAQEANALLNVPCEVVHSQTALETKALIATAAGVVSSRFHGLVSALSNCTPALATGWSHKYEELMSTYGVADHIVQISRSDTWREKLEDLFHMINDPAAHQRLRDHAETERAKARAMWQVVFSRIEGFDP